MNLSELRQQMAAISGDGLSIAEKAIKIGNAVIDEANTSYDKLEALSGIISRWCTNVKELNTEDAQDLHDLLNDSTNRAISLTTDKCKSITINSVLTGSEETVYVNGTEQASWQLDDFDKVVSESIQSSLQVPTKYSDGSDMDISFGMFIENLTNGIQMPRVYGELCKVVADNCDSDPSTLVSQVSSIIGAKFDSLSEIKTSLLSAAASGSEALLNMIKTVYTKLDTLMTASEQSGTVDLNSTTFDVAAFSWGIVGGTVITVAQIAASVISAIGGVVGVIAALVGAAVTVIKNIVFNTQTTLSDAAFINVSPYGSPSFNVVLDEYTIYSEALELAVQTIESDTFTITCDQYPCVITGYRVSENNFKIQELPSANFSFAKILFADLNFGGFVINTNALLIGRLTPVSRSSTTPTTPCFFIRKTALSSSNFDALVKSVYDPISVSISNYLDQLKDFTQTNIRATNANIYMERLLTSIILWLISKNRGVLLSICNNKSWNWLGFLSADSQASYNTLLGKQYQLLMRMCYYYATAMRDGSDWTTNIHFADVQDMLIQTVGAYFNKLKWRDTTQYSEYEELYFAHSNDTYIQNVSVDSVNETWLANLYYPATYRNDLLGGFTTSFATLAGTNYSNVTGSLSKSCSIRVPKALFTGVILGIIVDVVMLVAMAVIATTFVKLGMKAFNKFRRMSIDTEARKYQYEKSVQEHYPPEEQDLYWNEYKASRFKTKLVGLFLGRSFNDDLFTTDSSSTDSIKPILGSIKGATTASQESTYTLGTIIRKLG